MARPLVYVAAPYRICESGYSLRLAALISDDLWQNGFVTYVPQSLILDMIAPRPYEQWRQVDHEFLARCEAMICLPGECEEKTASIAYAIKNGIPIFYSLEEIIHGFALEQVRVRGTRRS